MSNHTPGPWTFKGRTVRGPHPRDPEGRTRIVANAIWDRGTYVGEAEANAHLIAAAPELLDVLELALRAHGTMLLSDPPQDPWVSWAVEQKARAAIAKATGVLAEGDSKGE